MRVAVYTDYTYHRAGDVHYGERAFVLFMCALRRHASRVVLVGRLHPEPGTSHYRLPDDVEVLGLPHYETLAEPRVAIVAMVRSLRRFWRLLDDVDVVWLLGPYLHAFAYALLARLRGRGVVLGVRQDQPSYVRSRYPRRRVLHVAADVLELGWRALARWVPIVAVGPQLAANYGRGRQVLQIAVSLVSEADIVEPGAAPRGDGDELVVLSVGRLDKEKNPLLLADILSLLVDEDPRWRLVVVGDGPMREVLSERLEELGCSYRADLRGYVPADEGLSDLYRTADFFLHVSWTEGLPQVLFESFAAALPIVATAVGGVPAAAGEAALLVPPGDALAAAAALRRLAADAELREGLVLAGSARVRRHTLEAEVAQVAALLAEAMPQASAPGRAHP